MVSAFISVAKYAVSTVLDLKKKRKSLIDLRILVLCHLLNVQEVANLSEFLCSAEAIQSKLDIIHCFNISDKQYTVIGSTLSIFDKIMISDQNTEHRTLYIQILASMVNIHQSSVQFRLFQLNGSFLSNI